MDSVYATLIDYGLNETAAKYLNYLILMVVILAVSITITLIIYKVVLRFLFKRIKNNKYNWDDILFKNRVFHKIVMIIPGITTYNSAVFFDEFSVVVSKLSMIYILFTVILVGRALIKSAEDIYRQFSISKDRPIKGFLQVIEIILYIVLIIMIISIMVDKSPVALISGIGALTALTTLIFKDSIVGFVAGMQLTWNDMLRIGDWIEMSKYGADGDVIDITLNTVKIQNFDKTIVTIPTYALISDSFKNWRGMQEMGARRIKRSINIDITSIKFCTNEMLDRCKKINILKDYIKNKEIELKDSNEKTENKDLLINGRNLTNVGVFRIYVQNYISNHPKIHNGMTLMVRQLVPGDNGLPLEIYAFINDIDWVNYENIQSDIFDHLFAVAEFFELRIFQKPSSYDFNNAILNERKI